MSDTDPKLAAGIGGEIGDAIYALPTIRSLGARSLYAVEAPWCRPSWHQRSKTLKRLLESRPYIDSWKDHHGEHLDHNLISYRAHGHAFGETIINRIARFARVQVDQSQPWLEVDPDPRTNGRIVVNRCPRWIGERFPWKQIVQQFKREILFIGLESEWKAFCSEFGMVEYLRTADLLEASQAIRGSELFIGNQSSCNAVAEGLKHPTVLETCLTSMDCVTGRPSCTYSVTGELSFHACGKDFHHIPEKRGTSYMGQVNGVQVWHHDTFLCELMCRSAYLVQGLEIPPSAQIRASLIQA